VTTIKSNLISRR